MDLIDRECVRRLLESPDPEATLVFVRGDCLVLSAANDYVGKGLSGGEITIRPFRRAAYAEATHQNLIIACRKDLEHLLGGGVPITDRQLDLVADSLDNVVRDLGC